MKTRVIQMVYLRPHTEEQIHHTETPSTTKSQSSQSIA